MYNTLSPTHPMSPNHAHTQGPSHKHTTHHRVHELGDLHGLGDLSTHPSLAHLPLMIPSEHRFWPTSHSPPTLLKSTGAVQKQDLEIGSVDWGTCNFDLPYLIRSDTYA